MERPPFRAVAPLTDVALQQTVDVRPEAAAILIDCAAKKYTDNRASLAKTSRFVRVGQVSAALGPIMAKSAAATRLVWRARWRWFLRIASA